MSLIMSLLLPWAVSWPQDAAHLAEAEIPLQDQQVTESSDGAELLSESTSKLPSLFDDVLPLDRQQQVPKQKQVRVEQRVLIRIGPREISFQQTSIPNPDPKARIKFSELEAGKCLNIQSISAVSPTQTNRLILFMRDQRMFIADLEKACSARDFYAGFYLKPHKDGQMCVGRERLQSRVGTKCKLKRYRQLVASSVRD